jgi:hypothetical protein
MQWLQQGAKFDAGPVPANDAVKAIAQWEHFFNGRSLKQLTPLKQRLQELK